MFSIVFDIVLSCTGHDQEPIVFTFLDSESHIVDEAQANLQLFNVWNLFRRDLVFTRPHPCGGNCWWKLRILFALGQRSWSGGPASNQKGGQGHGDMGRRVFPPSQALPESLVLRPQVQPYFQCWISGWMKAALDQVCKKHRVNKMDDRGDREARKIPWNSILIQALQCTSFISLSFFLPGLVGNRDCHPSRMHHVHQWSSKKKPWCTARAKEWCDFISF